MTDKERFAIIKEGWTGAHYLDMDWLITQHERLCAELEDTHVAASIHADEHRKARREIEALRAQLDDAKDLLRDAGFLLIPNAPKLSHRICIFLAKLEELETPKCICGEINARHCPVHQELEKCDKGE